MSIICDPADAIVSAKPVQWAVDRLRQALTARAIVVRTCARLDEAPPDSLCVIASAGASIMLRDAGVAPPAEAEVISVVAGNLGQRETLIASGSDSRGLSYALTEIADAVALADDPWPPCALPCRSSSARPTRCAASCVCSPAIVEDKAWFNDRDFWRSYLSLLAAQRFNRFNLALGLGYDSPRQSARHLFLFCLPVLSRGAGIRRGGDQPALDARSTGIWRCSGSSATRRPRAAWTSSSDLWTHAYQWIDSPDANHVIVGLTPRDPRTVLPRCPGVAAEGMPEHQRA